MNSQQKVSSERPYEADEALPTKITHGCSSSQGGPRPTQGTPAGCDDSHLPSQKLPPHSRYTVSEGTLLWSCPQPLPLESGDLLHRVQVGYRTWGTLAPDGCNTVLVCHALTGTVDVDAWWGGVLGAGRAFDPRTDFIVCSNVLGGCYGSTGPTSYCTHNTWDTYGPEFPAITIRDMVSLSALHLAALGVQRLALVAGGSMGGMIAQEWAAMQPLPVDALVVVAAPAQHSPWAVGLGHTQRAAIRADAGWLGGRYPAHSPPQQGLALARMVAMCSYRSPESFALRFQRRKRGDGAFQVESYLRYQGSKLAGRFDPGSYIAISLAMDSHDLSRGRKGAGTDKDEDRGANAGMLVTVQQPALVLGITSDVLYPPAEVAALAEWLPAATLGWIDSPHGHDAFLIEQGQVNEAILSFRRGLGLQRLEGGSGSGYGYKSAAAVALLYLLCRTKAMLVIMHTLIVDVSSMRRNE